MPKESTSGDCPRTCPSLSWTFEPWPAWPGTVPRHGWTRRGLWIKSVAVRPQTMRPACPAPTLQAVARLPRYVFSDGWFHVTARGAGRIAVYRDDDDCRVFLGLLGLVVR